MKHGESKVNLDAKGKLPDESDDFAPSRSRDNHVALIAGIVAVLFVVYVLSPGPLTWMEKAGWLPPNATSWIRIFYYPLVVLYESFLPVKQFYDWWLSIFE